MRFWRWLTGASRIETVSEDWLKDWRQIAKYEEWTRRQSEGMVATDPLDMRRRELWEQALAKPVPAENIVLFEKDRKRA